MQQKRRDGLAARLMTGIHKRRGKWTRSTVSMNAGGFAVGCMLKGGWKRCAGRRKHRQRQDGMREATWVSPCYCRARVSCARGLARNLWGGSPQVRDCVGEKVRGGCRGRCVTVRVCCCGESAGIGELREGQVLLERHGQPRVARSRTSVLVNRSGSRRRGEPWGGRSPRVPR